MALQPGTKLGPYEIQSPIGAGGMGEVYRARDTRLGRDVAVKVLPEAFARDAERLRRFEQEARAVSALNHPNILAIYDIGTHDGAPFLVMELLEGETLRERLRSGPLPVRKALKVAVQMAQGVAAAHEKEIVHRDLKPANVFLTDDGRVKILDFGLAKLVQGERLNVSETQSPTRTSGGHVQTEGQTEAGVVLGTVGYMSPEQVRGKPADARSDIFALGTILYEMLSGRRAFEKDSSADTMAAILKDEPPELSGDEKKIAPAVERVVRHCLEKNPVERFQSARDFAFNLAALSDVSTSSKAALAAPSASEARGKRRLLFATIGTAGLIIVGIAAYYWGRGAATSQPVIFTSINFQPGAIFDARFARDGETILYSEALEGNNPQLFVRRPDYPAPQPLGPTDTALLSVSSKNELAILIGAQYVENRMFTGTLAVADLGGGAPREMLQNVQAADWSPDGSELAIIHEVNGKSRLEYPIGKMLYETAGYVSDLRFSPRGDLIAFFNHPLRYDDRGSLDVVDLAGHHKVLSAGYQALEGMAWARKGDEIYFSSCCTFSSGIMIGRVMLSGETRGVAGSPASLFVYDANDKGELLASGELFGMRLMALAPGAKTERDLSWLGGSIFPWISADGQRLLFTDSGEASGSNYALLLRKMDGSPAVRLGEGKAMGFSPDGSWALSILPGPPSQVVLYPAGPGEKRVLERGKIESYHSAQFFADGKRILTCGNEPSHATRCYVQDIDSGEPQPVTPEGTSDGLVSPDGKDILARVESGGYLVYPMGTGTPHKIPWLTANDTVARWSLDGGSLLVYQPTEVPARVERVDLSTGRRTPVKELAPVDRVGVVEIEGVAISDDGKSYAYSYSLQTSQLTLVDGVK
jgi:eukaryotic-like serine/threonine-protein kinase